MTIRTLEDLSDKLDSELIWRKKELAELQALIQLRSSSASKRNVLLRSATVILYAHWEGFIKAAAVSYLEFVAMQRLRYDELSCNFIALAMKEKLNQAKETNKAVIFTEVADFFLTKLSERSSVPYKNVIQTGSNLSSSILREITLSLGLDYSLYETREVFIDEKLLSRRNNIAHGEYLTLDNEDYSELHDKVLEMMEIFRNQINNCAAIKSYCQARPQFN